MAWDDPVKISHRLTILVADGKPMIMAQYAMSLDDVIAEIDEWIRENRRHRRAGFVEEWLSSYRDKDPIRSEWERLAEEDAERERLFQEWWNRITSRGKT